MSAARIRDTARAGDGHVWTASVFAVVGLLLVAVEVGIFLTHPPLRHHQDRATVELWQYATQGSALLVAGLLVLARRAAPAIGWLLLGPAVVFMVAACLSTWLRFATAVTPGVQAAVYVEYVLWQVPRIALIVLPLCLPSGRPPGGWRRRLAAGLTAVVVLHEAGNLVGLVVWHPGTAAMPNALLIPAVIPVMDAVRPALEVVMTVGVVAAALSPLAYWRAATGVQRRQIALTVSVFVLLIAEEIARLLQDWSPWVQGAKIALGVLVPAALAYAVLRDRLFDLDTAARRVVGVAVPVALLGAVYAVAALTMSVLVPGAGAAVPAAVAVLSALVGLVLRPAARWVQRRVDGLLYGDRAEPYEVARRLAVSLRSGADAQVPLAVCQIVVSALRLPAAALQAGTGGSSRLLAVVGDAATFEPIPLRYQGRLVGHLLVAPRSGEAVLDELDRAALQPLADLAAPAVSANLLAEELQSSRASALTAREDERSRLRRDVHDGVGPTLAAIRLQVDTAVALLPAGSPSGALLGGVSQQLGDVVDEIRRVTENVRPPVLEERGLSGALTLLAERLSTPELPIGLSLDGPLPVVPSTVEVAAYLIAAEAVTNAVRHAAADTLAVRLTVDGDALVVVVDDDGAGMVAGRRGGIGLSSMAQRAADVGGSCSITGGATGTTVTARLPLAVAMI